MFVASGFLQNSLVLDAEIVRRGKYCKLVLKSAESKQSACREFESWHTLRNALARFIDEQRLALADAKFNGPDWKANHTFISVPFSRVPLQALGFSPDHF
jgi:hypothetical protein